MNAPAHGVKRALQAWLLRDWGPLPAGAWLLVGGVALLLYGFNLAGARALTEHEIFVAGVAKQMDASGDYLLPRVGDRLWLEKPPLPHWLAIATSRTLGGFSEASVRLPSVASAVGVVLLVTWLAARWFGPIVGVLSGLFQASSVYMLTYARLAECDMLLCLIVVAALVVYAAMQPVLNGAEPRRPRLLAASFWLLFGLTNMVKGPLFGAMLIAAVVAVWLISRRDVAGVWRLWSPWGLLAGALLAVAWPAAVLHSEPAAWDLWHDHLLGRATGEVSFNEKPFWYYATCWPWQLLPWTPFVVIAALPTLRRAWSDRGSPERFLWCWALVPMLLLSLSKGKHHHYLIYALPALAPVAALGAVAFCRALARRGELARHWANLCLRFFAPAAVIGAVAGFWLAGAFRVDAVVVGLTAAIMCVAGGLLVRRSRPMTSIVVTIAIVVLLELYAHGRVMPARDPSAADREFFVAVERATPQGARVVACGGPEIARHIFYLDWPVEGHWEFAAIAPATSSATPYYVVARAAAEPQLATLGRVSRLEQSAHTRREASAADRFTLFRVEPTQVATRPQ